MNLPRYLLDHLAATTGVDHRIANRAIRRQPCPDCRAWVLRALDGDTCAEDVSADPTPLTRLGETVAHRAGIPTWTLALRGGRLELDPRDPWTVAAHPPETLQRADVVPGHVCDRTWLAPTRSPTRLPTRRRQSTHTDMPPPF